MRLFFIMFFVLITSVEAGIGKILKSNGKSNAYVVRKNTKIKINPNLLLEEGDQLYSNNSQILVMVFPDTQIVLDKKSRLKFSSDIEFTKGKIKVRIVKNPEGDAVRKIQAREIAYISGLADFEISYGKNKDIDLFVTNGEVQAASPHIHTFVPEIIKSKEGLKFNIEGPRFSKQTYSSKFKADLSFTEMAVPSKLK